MILCTAKECSVNLHSYHCSNVGPHLGTRVPMRTFFIFLGPQKVPTLGPKRSPHSFQGSLFQSIFKNTRLGPHSCLRRSPLGPHLTQNWVPILDKIGSPWQVGAVSYPSYKYYFRKFFSMQLITGSDFNNAGISCKENLDL